MENETGAYETGGDVSRPVASHRRRFPIAVALAVTAALCAVVAAGYALIVIDGSEHSRGRAGETVFTVVEGEGARTLAGRLEDAGIVRSDLSFLYYLFRNVELRRRLQAGEYLVSGEMTIPELVSLFASGKTHESGVRVTFPEGWTADQMAERLDANGLPGDAFLEIVRRPDPELRREHPFLAGIPSENGLEGVLFPDTYLFDTEAGADGIVRKMLDGFESKALPGLSDSGWYDELILASILETEVRTTSDRKTVADLFLRRLETGMALQSDATLRYVLGETKVKHSLDDLEFDSPYNTYRYPGLPPGPVSNPGVDAVSAATDPSPNPYWYFLNNPETGETVFSVTFEEHVANKAKNGL